MKVFRDMCIAVLLGTLGGFLVSTISYYNDNKEGGIEQTMAAVQNSFDIITKAYSVSGNEPPVQETLGEISMDDLEAATDVVLGELLNSDGELSDVLVMDEEDGQIDEGEPYSGIMRFHVRANSDSSEDQELKLAVKEDVVAYLKPLLEKCKSVSESKNVIVANLQNIYTIAVNTIVEQGYDYSVEVYVTEETFPAKTYGDITFPAGQYQALRVDIGEAKGQNWWCVMFPPLCFIDESTAMVSEEGKEILEENLTPEEYAELFATSDVEAELWILEWLQGNE
ncbi:MAG: stage II sporulation protein R [Lachnospiraceae bacterium]|nr:stage II sporulation protein R [Lachnospiraceae bacterium]